MLLVMQPVPKPGNDFAISGETKAPIHVELQPGTLLYKNTWHDEP